MQLFSLVMMSNGNWIIKNQWGTSWGESGFATISKLYNCGLSAWVFQYSSTTPYSGNTDYTVTSFYNTKKYEKNYTFNVIFSSFLNSGYDFMINLNHYF
jgi:C1A family cysteine protease